MTAGSGCDRYQTDQWPTGFPHDWPPLPTGIEVSPGQLTMHVNHLGVNAGATTTLYNHTSTDAAVHIDPDASGHFTHPSGDFTAPAYGQLPISVMFQGGDEPGT